MRINKLLLLWLSLGLLAHKMVFAIYLDVSNPANQVINNSESQVCIMLASWTDQSPPTINNVTGNDQCYSYSTSLFGFNRPTLCSLGPKSTINFTPQNNQYQNWYIGIFGYNPPITGGGITHDLYPPLIINYLANNQIDSAAFLNSNAYIKSFSLVSINNPRNGDIILDQKGDYFSSCENYASFKGSLTKRTQF